VPDFGGNIGSIEKIMRARADIIGHNIETVKRLYDVVRSGSDYDRSLALLKTMKRLDPDQLTKSSIMVGLGETDEEIVYTMKNLRMTECDILTIGQYLRPGKDNLPIKRFVKPEEFELYKLIGKDLGFKFISSAPFVRSSYFAYEIYKELEEKSHDECYTTAIS